MRISGKGQSICRCSWRGELGDENLFRMPPLQSEEVGGLPGICFCRSNLVK